MPAPPPTDTPRTRRRALRPGEIADAAAAAFAAKGVANTTLQDVADRLGVSRGTIYNHVRSRGELLRLVVHGYVGLHREWLVAVRARGDLTPEQRLREAIRILTRGNATHPHHARIFQPTESEIPPDLWAEQRTSLRVMQQELELIVRDGVETGSFAPVDPRLTAMAIFGMLNWIPVWFRADGPSSIEDVAAFFSDLVLGGLRASVGAARSRDPLHVVAEMRELLDTLRGELAERGRPEAP